MDKKKIKEHFVALDNLLTELNDKEMGETGIYEDVQIPMRKLMEKIGIIPIRQYMVLGINDYPVNPNDYIPGYTEKDTPYIFGSEESARKFIEIFIEKSVDPVYLKVVELV